MAGIELHRVEADDVDALKRYVEVDAAVQAVDCPWVPVTTPRALADELTHGWDLEPGRAFLATAGGTTVGAAICYTSEWDNRHLAWLLMQVHPEHRRRGHGTAMLAALREVVRAEGRTSLGVSAWDGTAGASFARGRGLEPRSRSVNRRQHLDEVDRADVEALHAAAAREASAYELLRWTGRTPEDSMEAVAAMTAAINDAPVDDLDIEDEVFPPQRIRDYETAQLARGRLYRVLARHRESGELAGHTVVHVDAERHPLADQHDTSVVRAHRGHRLGLLLKSEMLLWLRDAEPGVAAVDTWNAESNDHMISVNERLGYRVMGRTVQLQGEVGAGLTLAG